jgi:hypothetical protein
MHAIVQADERRDARFAVNKLLAHVMVVPVGGGPVLEREIRAGKRRHSHYGVAMWVRPR